VDVADRAGDDYQVLRAARQESHPCLFRIQHNRRVFLSAEHDRQG